MIWLHVDGELDVCCSRLPMRLSKTSFVTGRKTHREERPQQYLSPDVDLTLGRHPSSANKLTFSSLHVLNSRDKSSSSSASIHSSVSQQSNQGPHPFSAMVSAPLPVVSNRGEEEDEEECPVCLEPLSFSFRLPGEKPHIVPECGHALHEVRPRPLTPPQPLTPAPGMLQRRVRPPAEPGALHRAPQGQPRRVRRVQAAHEARR